MVTRGEKSCFLGGGGVVLRHPRLDSAHVLEILLIDQTFIILSPIRVLICCLSWLCLSACLHHVLYRPPLVSANTSWRACRESRPRPGLLRIMSRYFANGYVSSWSSRACLCPCFTHRHRYRHAVECAKELPLPHLSRIGCTR